MTAVKKFDSNFYGGLALNWNDIEWQNEGVMQTIKSLIEGMVINGTTKPVVFDRSREFLYEYINDPETYQPGIITQIGQSIYWDGELLELNIVGETTVAENNVVWLEKVEDTDAAGDKYSVTNNVLCHTYKKRYARVVQGAQFPATTHYPLTGYEGDVLYFCDLVSTSTQQLYAQGTFFDTSHLTIKKQGKRVFINGYVTANSAFITPGNNEMFRITGLKPAAAGGVVFPVVTFQQSSGNSVKYARIVNDTASIHLLESENITVWININYEIL